MATLGNCCPKACRTSSVDGSDGMGSMSVFALYPEPTAQQKTEKSYQESLDFGGRNDCKLTCRYSISTAFFSVKDNTHLYK